MSINECSDIEKSDSPENRSFIFRSTPPPARHGEQADGGRPLGGTRHPSVLVWVCSKSQSSQIRGRDTIIPRLTDVPGGGLQLIASLRASSWTLSRLGCVRVATFIDTLAPAAAPSFRVGVSEQTAEEECGGARWFMPFRLHRSYASFRGVQQQRPRSKNLFGPSYSCESQSCWFWFELLKLGQVQVKSSWREPEGGRPGLVW